MGDWSKADVVMAYMVSVPMSNWSPLDIKNFPGIAQGKAFLLQKAWAPYCDENEGLNATEKEEVKLLKAGLNLHLRSKDVRPTVLRAVLLSILKELDQHNSFNN